MRIREGELTDVDDLIPIFQRFVDNELKGYPIKFQVDKAVKTITELTNNHLTIVMEIEDAVHPDVYKIVGAMSGMVVNSLMGEEIVYQEIFFYILDEYRNHSVEFLRTVKQLAKCKGIDKIVVGAFQNEKLGKFYLMNGFKFLETHYYQEL